MRIKNVIDISRKIHPGIATWPGDGGVEIHRDASIKDGASCNLSSIRMGLHTGTHIDAPFHFINDGDEISSLDLSKFIGLARVFRLDVEKCITAEDIKDLPIEAGSIVLFKTANSLRPEDSPFFRDYIYLDISAARLLADMKIKSVGVDYLSVDGYKLPGHPVHKLLLSNKVGVIEGLYLNGVNEGKYFLSCLPLRLDGVDGSPARAVLLEPEADY